MDNNQIAEKIALIKSKLPPAKDPQEAEFKLLAEAALDLLGNALQNLSDIAHFARENA